jgi:hypothetical protein
MPLTEGVAAAADAEECSPDAAVDAEVRSVDAAVDADELCAVCLDAYRDKSLLKCGHSYCSGCVDEQIRIQQGVHRYGKNRDGKRRDGS